MVTCQLPARLSTLYLHWPLTPAKRPACPVSCKVPSPDEPAARSPVLRLNSRRRMSSDGNVTTPSASSSKPVGDFFEKLANWAVPLAPSANGPPLLLMKVIVPLPL